MSGSIEVLHVDDDPAFLELAEQFLERQDDRIEVDTATDAESGLDRLEEREFDCVVSDYDMPGTNGIEFLEAVRTIHPDLPFVLFTGKGSEEIASEAIAAGVTDYLQKSPRADQYTLLANRIVNAVARRRAQTNYRELFDRIHVGLTLHDPETGHITDANEAFADFLKTDRARLIGTHPGDLTPPDSEFDRERATRLIRQTLKEGSRTIEWLDRTEDSEELWVEVNLAPTRIDGREQVLAVVQDVTDRKRREQKLERLRERTRELTYTRSLEATADRAVEAADEIIGAPLSGLLLPTDDGSALEPIAAAESVDRWFDESDEFLARILATAAETALGTVEREARLRKQRDELERQFERLDEFASVVSHDLRNPLMTAAGRLELARRECDSDHLAIAAHRARRKGRLHRDRPAGRRRGVLRPGRRPRNPRIETGGGLRGRLLDRRVRHRLRPPDRRKDRRRPRLDDRTARERGRWGQVRVQGCERRRVVFELDRLYRLI